MKKERFHTEKAYKNLEFLNSPDARAMRILAEFLEPLAHFRRERIRDTVVFFGSARLREGQRIDGSEIAEPFGYVGKFQNGFGHAESGAAAKRV